MMTKHTPGPWQVDQDPMGVLIISGPEGETVFYQSLPTGTVDSDQANAQLVAAAPRVTEALSEMLVFFADRATTQLEIDAVNEARGALAQADDSELPSIEEMSGSIHPDCEIFETRKEKGNA